MGLELIGNTLGFLPGGSHMPLKHGELINVSATCFKSLTLVKGARSPFEGVLGHCRIKRMEFTRAACVALRWSGNAAQHLHAVAVSPAAIAAVPVWRQHS